MGDEGEILCRDCMYYAGERGTNKGTCINMASVWYQVSFFIHRLAPTEVLVDDDTMEPIAEVTVCYEEAGWGENEGDKQTGGHA